MKNTIIEVIKSSITESMDARSKSQKRHKLTDVVVIAICSIICGGEGWYDMEYFGLCKEEWLRNFLELEHGIPSESTFMRVISSINPECFGIILSNVANALKEVSGHNIEQRQKHLAIDGKSARRSFDKEAGKKALHLVNVYGSEEGLCFGQVEVSEKSNEITAIPEIIDMIEIKNAIVTIDAMGCQKKITSKIKSKKGEYILGLKKNHKDLFESVENVFKTFDNQEIEKLPEDIAITTIEKSHGRIETRTCVVIEKESVLNVSNEWEGLSSFVMISSTREIGDKITKEKRYYLSSLKGNPNIHASTIRSHWKIENSLHWTLDITFKEDQSRIRKKFGQQNLSLLRKLALNLLKKDKSQKVSIRAKRLGASWEPLILEKILFQSTVLST